MHPEKAVMDWSSGALAANSRSTCSQLTQGSIPHDRDSRRCPCATTRTLRQCPFIPVGNAVTNLLCHANVPAAGCDCDEGPDPAGGAVRLEHASLTAPPLFPLRTFPLNPQSPPPPPPLASLAASQCAWHPQYLLRPAAAGPYLMPARLRL